MIPTETRASDGDADKLTETPRRSGDIMKRPFWVTGLRLQIQSVLYNNGMSAIRRAVQSVARSAELAVMAGACTGVTLRYGDSSPEPRLDKEALASLRAEFSASLTIEYDYFNGNLGSAGGHNRLARDTDAGFILVQNPDVVVAPRLLEILLACFRRPGVGMAEAKQIPIEHPKDYDLTTGETSWATTACAMIPIPLFRQLDGFDHNSFFLYCDDVDFSWRVRLAGYKVVFQPSATAFHDKRLSQTGTWQPSGAEHFYSAEASLFMAHKWSRPDIVKKYITHFSAAEDENLRKMAKSFLERQAAGTLPEPVDPKHQVGQFVDIYYARHRYPL